jgi:two-component system chemotaxis response regulator CheB
VSGTGHIEGPFSLVVIVASAGGLGATCEVLERLPSDFSASVAVVQHRLPYPDYGVELLGRRCALPVEAMRDGATPLPGRVYLAPAMGQALIDDAGRFSIAGTDRDRGDPLFASAAVRFKKRVIAVVLTGRGDDGTLGVRAIKSADGRVIVQDGDAQAPSMPLSAVGTGCADFVLPVRVIGWALAALIMAPGAPGLFKVRVPAWAIPSNSGLDGVATG